MPWSRSKSQKQRRREQREKHAELLDRRDRALDLARQLAGSGWAVPASPTRVTVVVEVWQNKVYFSGSDFSGSAFAHEAFVFSEQGPDVGFKRVRLERSDHEEQDWVSVRDWPLLVALKQRIEALLDLLVDRGVLLMRNHTLTAEPDVHLPVVKPVLDDDVLYTDREVEHGWKRPQRFFVDLESLQDQCSPLFSRELVATGLPRVISELCLEYAWPDTELIRQEFGLDDVGRLKGPRG